MIKDSSAAKNFFREGSVKDVVCHWRLSNNWNLLQNTSKNLSKFVQRGIVSSASFWLRHWRSNSFRHFSSLHLRSNISIRRTLERICKCIFN